ncbi:hypothetical protein K458DRAFT_485250 [Lentithecium fluviatile CBS 122367]|uniref:Lysine-specific metallo-endopeptidase domain-containing protein n=1 Tax=Lentithecium fluviatile CBS 122367 TaxID=1168545 RepID=A0A6G1JD55_9PLEO|nr:hypothetical protein K458DRAFT_485250 [Lentithecium fluviatile CBS 122367]
MPPYLLYLALMFALLTCLTLVEGWKIDQSCRNAGIYDEVETALHEAFDMAEVAMQALERAQVRTKKDPTDAPRVENPWDEVPPRPSELQDLIKNLFAHDDIINESQQLPDVPAKKDTPYKQTLRKIKLSRAYETFKGILADIRDPGKKDRLEDLVWTDAIIYCDGSRYELKKGFWALDKENHIKRGLHKKQCFGPIDQLATLADTYSSVQKPDETFAPNTIQLCPPLIREIKRSQGANPPSYLKYRWGRIKSSVKKSAQGEFRQIDILGNGLAVTLLHEMTHTSAGLLRDDVKVKKGGFFGYGRGAAYGWENAKRLAKTLPYVDREQENACDNNADSLAYFALGCKLMSDQDNPRRIRDDGVIEPIDGGQPVNWTPNSWKRRWFEATGIPIP